ncbi:hypothetical protein [Streptomyces fumanus]|uniref:hypothetical protein n=1 Tax=Streptomyces fumanus TaxID=67302 RepID=UPI0033C9C800
MWPTIVAVLGTLAGVALTSVTQHLTQRQALADQHRREVTDAIKHVLETVLAYRELYWSGIDRARAGDTAGLAWEIYSGPRTAITTARDHLGLLADDEALLAAAEAAAWAAIDLNDIPLGPVGDGRFTDGVEAALDAGRDRARAAHTALVQAGRAYLHSRR